MHDTMDSDSGAGQHPMGEDLSALAWVHGELKRALETAHKALHRYLKEADAIGGSDVGSVDPAVLRMARNQLHQGVGALELVGLPAVADVLRSAETAVQRMVNKPALVDAASVATVEKVSFALLDYLARQLAGKPVSPVALFPQYRAALQLAGADRVHPADLWKLDWQWFEVPADPSATPRGADDDARTEMETLVLACMRQGSGDAVRGALARMSDLCADLGAGARQFEGGGQLATFWQLAAAVLEAQATGLLGIDVYTKRIASRLLAQLRMSVRGQRELSDRLAQDLLFFCSHAKAPDAQHRAPRLEAVRRTWRLADRPTADYDIPRLGRFDPALLVQAKKRVAVAKDSWSAVAGGEEHRLTGLADQFSLVGDSLTKLFPSGDVLAQALQTAVAQTVASGTAPAPALAMEVATGILYLDASLDDGELDQPELADRVQRLARRVDDVRIGADPQPLDMWMEELYRRVSDRQTMGSVVQELRASLSEVEKQIDQYFRNPAERQVLIPVPAQLSSMRGVLSVLGMTHASQAVLHMRDDVDALAQTEVDPQRAIQAGTFDRLADNLGALSFLIDMLSVQPQLAKSLFKFDPETGSLSAVMGQTERVSAFAALDEASRPQALPVAPAPAAATPLIEQVLSLTEAVAQPDVSDELLIGQMEQTSQQALAADQRELSRRLAAAAANLRADTAARPAVQAELGQALMSLAGAAPEALPPSAPVPPPRPAPEGGTGLEDDAEMRDIFIEEAREVVADAHAALERLADAPDNTGDMTAVRRAFHTLKGSSRMVGLSQFGEAAWSCEQLYNARLAQAPRVDGPLRVFTTEALHYLGDWTEAIAAGRDLGHNAPAVAKAADALRLDGVRLAIVPPTPAPQPAPAPPPPGAMGFASDPSLALPTLEIAEPEPEAPAPSAATLAQGLDAELEELKLDLPALADEVALAPVAVAEEAIAPTSEPEAVAEVAEVAELAEVAEVAASPEALEVPEVPEVPEPAPPACHRAEPRRGASRSARRRTQRGPQRLARRRRHRSGQRGIRSTSAGIGRTHCPCA
jgi:chemosensory pili system protein ChpA (sensor histidine kinase/response regulator)